MLSYLSMIGWNVHAAYHWMSGFTTTDISSHENIMAQSLTPSISIQDVGTHYAFIYTTLPFLVFSAVLPPQVISAAFISYPFITGKKRFILEWTQGPARLASLSTTSKR